MTISATTQGLRMGVATSSSRPTVPFDGQVISETDTDSLKVYNGTAWVGVGGLVSMPPTTVGKTGASSTATASAVGGVTFALCETLTLNGVFTSAYSNYRILWAGLASGNPTLTVRLVTAGTPASATDYNRQQLVASSTTVTGLRETSQTSWTICNNINTNSDNLSMDIFNPQATKMTTFNNISFTYTSGAYWQSVGGVHVLTTSYDGIQFIPSTGNFSGNVTVYGYNQ
jgi:hypothetical protein